MKLEINNTFYKNEACEIFKRICWVTDIEVAANIATRVAKKIDYSGSLEIYRGGNHVALLSKDSSVNRLKQVAIFTS